jgi:hypothetical protein
MMNMRLSLPTVLVLVALVGAGAFAAGQSAAPDSSSSFSAPPASRAATAMETAEPQTQRMPELPTESDDLLPPGHPPTTTGGAGAGGALPPGHPPVDSTGKSVAETTAADSVPTETQKPLEWQVPARWQLVPNASSFRLATCRVPHAPGDADDADLSVARAAGSVDANAERWIGQFDAEGQKTAKRAHRMVGGLPVTIIEVRGAYSGGMGEGAAPRPGWALLGAIVSTPGTPYFFKLTGPAKTVTAARGEFDAMIAGLVQR